MGKKINRLGEINISNEGYIMKIVEYNGATDIVVEFQDNYKGRRHTGYNKFKDGGVRNPYHKSVYGVACVGDTKGVDSQGKPKKSYEMWIKMIQRCYDLESQRGMNKTYTECKVCEKWLCYECFEQDYELLKQEIGFSEKDYRLDKDIISKGNKVYCFEKCCIVNHEINCLFIKADAIRGDFPIGVTKCENKYLARLSKKDEQGRNIRV